MSFFFLGIDYDQNKGYSYTVKNIVDILRKLSFSDAVDCGQLIDKFNTWQFAEKH